MRSVRASGFLLLLALATAPAPAPAARVIPGPGPEAALNVVQNGSGQLIVSVSGDVPACGIVPVPGDPTYTIHDHVIDVTQPGVAVFCPTPAPGPKYFYSTVNVGRVFDGTYTINWNIPALSQQYTVQGNPGVDAAFSGNWYDPGQSGHGFTLEVVPGNPKLLVAYWFVFDATGGEAWIAGSGPITGNGATLAAYQVTGSGAQFPPRFDPAHVAAQPWGTLTFTFDDCNHGRVDWSSTATGYGSGSLPLSRLTQPAGLACP